MLEKVPYQDNPLRYEYVLTQKGLDMHPVLVTLTGWGNKWMADKDGIPLEYHHKNCDHKTQPVLSCDHCGDELKPHDLRTELGPGLTKKFARGEQPVYISKKFEERYSKTFKK